MNYLILSLIAFSYTRIPQRLPEGPLIQKVNTQVVEGHYMVVATTYKSTAYIKQVPNTKVYLVFQYTGPTILKGIGFMDGNRFVIGWEQEKSIGASTICFQDGKGRASWVSNPGSGQVSHETWSLINAED